MDPSFSLIGFYETRDNTDMIKMTILVPYSVRLLTGHLFSLPFLYFRLFITKLSPLMETCVEYYLKNEKWHLKVQYVYILGKS